VCWVSDCGGFWVTDANQGFIYVMKGFVVVVNGDRSKRRSEEKRYASDKKRSAHVCSSFH